jgi:hypothetical protein
MRLSILILIKSMGWTLLHETMALQPLFCFWPCHFIAIRDLDRTILRRFISVQERTFSIRFLNAGFTSRGQS